MGGVQNIELGNYIKEFPITGAFLQPTVATDKCTVSFVCPGRTGLFSVSMNSLNLKRVTERECVILSKHDNNVIGWVRFADNFPPFSDVNIWQGVNEMTNDSSAVQCPAEGYVVIAGVND